MICWKNGRNCDILFSIGLMDDAEWMIEEEMLWLVLERLLGMSRLWKI